MPQKKRKKITSKKTDLYYGHGTDHLLSKNYSKALEYLLKANELSPKNSKILNNLGMAYYFKGQTKTAIQILKSAINANEKNSDARNNLASIYFNLGEYELAKEQYHIIEKNLIYTHQYRTHYNLSLIYEKQNNFTEMVRRLEKSVNDRPEYCPAHIKLGQHYLKNEQLSKAVKSFKQGSQGTCYKYPNSTYLLAFTWEKMADTDKASDKYLEVISTFPNTEFSKLAKNRLENLIKKEPILDLKLKKNNTPRKR